MRKQEGLYPFDVLLTRSPDAVGIGAGVLKPDWFDPCPKPGTDHFPKREFHLHADGRKRNRWGSQAQARGSVRVVLVSKGVLIECIYAHGQSFRRPLPNQTSTPTYSAIQSSHSGLDASRDGASTAEAHPGTSPDM